MCGIGGIVHFRGDGPEVPRLRAMAEALRHRGPDAWGTHVAGPVGLASTRLSIIDVAGGSQPMALPDSDTWLAFNGELYNYIELRDELSRRGRRFSTQSDTEVVLTALDHWGEDALHRFNGQWAIGLWQGDRRRLLLARDPMGIHPLYYAQSEGSVLFASEVKALFAAAPSLRRGLDPIGLDETLTFWAALAPRTVFSGICELPPGHVRTYVDGASAERPYFALRFAPRPLSLPEAEVEVRDALERATVLRVLRADVPVGCYLSGGLDSSLIAALGVRATGDRLHTFSLRFTDAEYDETAYQRIVARALGTEHHEVEVSGDDIARVFPAVVRHAERPLLRTAAAPLFLLSKLVADLGFKVVLTGEGADELFAGYDLFREGAVRRFWARQPASTRRPRLLERLYPYMQRSPVSRSALARQFFGQDLAAFAEPGFAHGTRWRTAVALRRLVAPDMRPPLGTDVARDFLATLPHAFRDFTPLAQDQFIEIQTLLGPYLLGSQGDRMLMAHSVEGRFPFLDPDVIALASALPDRFKLRGLSEKYILKRVAAPLVPAEVVERSKQPYRAPDARSFLSAASRPAVDELLAPRAVARAGVLDPRAIDALWRKCKSRPADDPFSNTDNMALVAAISTQLLCRELLGMAV